MVPTMRPTALSPVRTNCAAPARGLIMRTCLPVLLVAATLIEVTPAMAGSVEVRIDASLADYIVELSCSGEDIDEDWLRGSRLLQTQIRHHAGNAPHLTMDAFVAGARAAARCEVLDPDPYRFRYVVEDRESIARAVAYFKAHERELAAFVGEKTAAYFPPERTYAGDIVIVAASFSCGGFSMDGAFYIDVPCVAGAVDDEFEAVKTLAAHETYHALQYTFFTPFSEDIAAVESADAAQAFLFLNLLLEGTAEYVADSRDVPGEGQLARILRRFAERGYRQLDEHFRWLDYAATVLAEDRGSNRRIRDIYDFGFTGGNGQPFYYVGTRMARQIEDVFGREALVCIIAQSPEQFVLAYYAASGSDGQAQTYPIGPAALAAARKLAVDTEAFRSCLKRYPSPR